MKQIRLVLLGLVAGINVFAQADSTFAHSVLLPAAEVHPVSDDPEAAVLFVPDSLLTLTAKGGSLGDLLMHSSALNLRTYGPQGTLITAAGRGLSADHIQVYWMGVSLNSPSLGLTDLSAIPFALFDGVRVQSGTSLTRSQAGSAGGSIHLTSNASETIEAGMAYNALNNRSNWLRISQTYFKRLYTTTRVSIDRAENDFSYRDPFLINQPERQQSRNNFLRNALIQEFKYTAHRKFLLEAGVWLQESQLEIPELMGGFSQQVTDQRDSSLRMSVNASWFTNRGKFTLRTARLLEFQLYKQRQSLDVEPHVESNIATQRTTAQLFWLRQLPKFDFEAGIEYQNEAVQSTNHENRAAQRELLGVQGRIRYSALNDRLSVVAASRYDAGIVGNEPVYDLKLNWKLSKDLQIFSNGRRIFRYPDLNELFWRPGGNQFVLPELGWSFDVGLNGNLEKQNLKGCFSVSGFLQDMENMIVWLTNNGGVQARNVNAVRSMGVESTASLIRSWNRLQFKQNMHVIIQRHQGLSTLESTFFPEIQANYNAAIYGESWFLSGAIRAAATTLTPVNINATRGEQDAVFMTDIQAGKTFDAHYVDVSIAVTCRNITNVLDYRTSRFASPGRVIGVQMNMNLKSRKIRRGI
jgi:iron complex outermembrane receptor protein